MFDREQAITEWRQRMRAGGIITPPTLDELESHLRESMGEKVRAGWDEAAAFKAAGDELGKAGLLKREFAWAGGLWGGLGENLATRLNRLLALTWVGLSFWLLSNTLLICHERFFQDATKPTAGLLILVLGIIAFQELGGIIGGILLLRGAAGGRYLICTVAVLALIPDTFALFHPHNHPATIGYILAHVFFDLVTLWWLRPGRHARVAVN